MSDLINENKQTIIRASIIIAVLLGLFLLVATAAKLKEYRYIGSGTPAGNTITVTGEGNVERAPDTARMSFTVRSEAVEVNTAQDAVAEKITKIKADLEMAGIDEDDISTATYNSYPQYTYPANQKPTLRGYEVAQAVTVKVKDLTLVENVISILGNNGVTDMQGPNFGFDDDKEVAREARENAIKDAKEQAKKLADDLGVDLVRIVSFNEQSGSTMPMPYGREMMMAQDAKATGAANIPVGTADISSTVTIVYEIR
ncbi:MAG TPA: SIMPL domain-containing protein [Candidatus Paceibacterota bacterium]